VTISATRRSSDNLVILDPLRSFGGMMSRLDSRGGLRIAFEMLLYPGSC
jgi:hypothetical protein